jgi:branched-chain amino acid transport system substrate-binding protein
LYSDKLIKEGKKLKRWYMINPDYTYGRTSYEDFIYFMKKLYPETEIVAESWPKLFEPDYTPYITKMLEVKPDAVYTSLWGGDIASFVKQGALYGLFDKVAFFANDLADHYLLRSIESATGNVPVGIHSGLRVLENFPDTDLNRDFAKRYEARWNKFPVKWAQEGYLACRFYEEAVKKAGTIEKEAVVNALEGLTIKGPWGSAPNSTVTMRARDHKAIGMAIGWGETISKPPYVKNAVETDWNELLKYEKEWLISKGWIKKGD